MCIPVLAEPGGLVGCWVLSEEKGAQPGSVGTVLCSALPMAAPRVGPTASSQGLQRRAVGMIPAGLTVQHTRRKDSTVNTVLRQKGGPQALGGAEKFGRPLWAGFWLSEWSEDRRPSPWGDGTVW